MKKLIILLFFISTFINNTFGSEEKPNILFIAIDDAKPMFGCYGNTKVKTPNIDKLAKKATVFKNNHCQWPVCGPSRASIMTSLMPEETGVKGFKAMRFKLPDLITLPQHFKNNGYITAAAGKINDPRCVGKLNSKNPSGRTIKDGKDDILSWSIPYKSPPHAYSSPTKRSCEAPDLSDDEFVDGKILKQGLELLKTLTKSDKPFFLGVGFKKPHVPWYAPKKYWDLYKRDDFKIEEFQQLPEGGTERAWKKGSEVHNYHDVKKHYKGTAKKNGFLNQIIDEQKQKELIHSYYACVSFIDAQIGILLEELEKTGKAKNTIVVIWGDHGYHLGDHAQWGKHALMEESTHSPMIIYSPKISKEIIVDSPTGFIDVYPTLCDLANLPHPEQPKNKNNKSGRKLKGVSLLPLISGEKISVRKGIITNRAGGYAFRTERYRYIEFINKNGKINSRDLYDYKTDPQERKNLINEPKYQDIIKKLSTEMRKSPEALGCKNLLQAKSG